MPQREGGGNKKDRQCTYNVTLVHHRINHCCSRKAISVTYDECVFVALGWGHNILTSRELMWCYACSWDVRGDLTSNSMAQIHTSVTLLTSRDLTWSSGRLKRQHASHISVVAHISWGVTKVSSALHMSRCTVTCPDAARSHERKTAFTL